MKCLRCEKDSTTREVCSNCGASLKDQIQEIIEKLNKKEKKKSDLIKSLATTMDLRAVMPLVNVAMKDEDMDCRLEAIKALGQLQDRDVIPFLIELLLKDKSSQIRVSAAQSIGKLKGHKAMEALFKALADPVPEVKIASIEALESLGTGECINMVSQLLTGQDPRVERAALESLQRLGYQVGWDGDRVAQLKLKTSSQTIPVLPIILVFLVIIGGLFFYKSLNPEKRYLTEVKKIVAECRNFSKSLFLLTQELEKIDLSDQQKVDAINMKSAGIEGNFRRLKDDLKSMSPPAKYTSLNKDLSDTIDIYVYLSRSLVAGDLYSNTAKAIKNDYTTIEDGELKLIKIKKQLDDIGEK